MRKRKKMLVNEIKESGYQIQEYLSKDKLERISNSRQIALTYKHSVKREGWMEKPKDLLQVIWEQGFLDESNLNLYSLKGKKNQLDKDGKPKEDFPKYSLCTLMCLIYFFYGRRRGHDFDCRIN